MAWIAKTFLAIAISIILALFVGYGLNVFYEPPQRDYGPNGCYKQFDCEKIGVGANCLKSNYSYGPYAYDCAPTYDAPEYKKCIDDRQKCDDDYQKTTVRFKVMRNSFIILVLIAIISIIVGMLLSKFEGIGSGLIGGGVLIILWSLIYTSEFWVTLDKYMKLFALGIVLILLIYLGYKRLDKIVNVEKKSKK